MTYPTNHQELFEAFINAEITIISEYSSSVSQENAELKQWSKVYATEHGLVYEDKS